MEINDILIVNTLVFADAKINRPDAIYLFAQTKDNQASVLDKATELAKEHMVPIAICGGKGSGYPGFNSWHDELTARDIPSKYIVPIRPLSPLHTLTEAIGLVREAKKREWKDIIIVSSPFHQVRAFLSTLHALLSEYPSLNVYNQTGIAMNWNEYAAHHQGLHSDYRKNFIHGG